MVGEFLDAGSAPFAWPTGKWPHDLDHVARLVVEQHEAAPCAVVAAASLRRGVVAAGAAGALTAGGDPATTSTVFDLASVTKPVTALLAARLARRGVLSLSTPLGEVLEEAVATPSGRVPIELFLAHRAGLDGHRPLYAPLLEGRPVDRSAALREAAAARRAGCEGPPPPDGFAPVYSDLGYLLVGAALERAAGRPLDALVNDEVAAPCGARVVAARGLTVDEARCVAPTEVVAFRGGAVRAEVHDENAWAFGVRGLCGHAGLFGSAPGVLRLGVAVAEALAGQRPEWLTPEQLDPLVRLRPGGTLRAGFDGKSASGSSAGAYFGAASVGHLGFTGTSLWVDPEAGVVAVVLSNRVHPSRATDAIRRARPEAHDAIWRWAHQRVELPRLRAPPRATTRAPAARAALTLAGQAPMAGTVVLWMCLQSASVNSSVEATPPRSRVRDCRDA